MSTPLVPLRRVFKVINGGTPTSDEINWNGDVPWATPADFGPQLSSIDTTRRTLSRVGVRTGSTVAPIGALLISTRAPVGYVAVTSRAMAFNQGCRALVPRTTADARFFGYQLEARKSDLQAEGLGTTFLELSSDKLAAFRVHVPPADDQRRIADFLDAETAKIDSYVNLHERLISALHEKTSATIESLLLYGHGQPSEASHSDPAPFPSRFPIGRLKNVASRVDVGIAEAATHAYVTDGVPLIRSTNIRANYLETHDLLHVATWFAERNRSKYAFTGDILTVRTGNAGVSAVIPQELNRSQTFTQLITTLKDGNSAEYFCHFLNSRVCRQYFDIVSWGSAQKNISVPLLADTPVPIPPIKVQRKISESVEHLSEMNASLISKAEKARRLASERRQALITAAVTGQFDVSTASGRNVTEGVTAP